jgi:hypothetical protein
VEGDTQTAKLVGVWMFIPPRRSSDNVNVQGAATLILTAKERDKIGNKLMNIQVKVMDQDPGPDHKVHEDNSFSLGPALLNIGPTTFGINAIVPHDDVEDPEPFFEFAFAGASVWGGVATRWVNSQTEDVAFE